MPNKRTIPLLITPYLAAIHRSNSFCQVNKAFLTIRLTSLTIIPFQFVYPSGHFGWSPRRHVNAALLHKKQTLPTFKVLFQLFYRRMENFHLFSLKKTMRAISFNWETN
jgi:hypothetical protein